MTDEAARQPRPRGVVESAHLAHVADLFTRCGYPMTFGTAPAERPGQITIVSGLSFRLSYVMPSELLHDEQGFAAYSREMEPPALAHALTQLAADCVGIARLALGEAQRFREQPAGWDSYDNDNSDLVERLIAEGGEQR